MSDPPDVVGSAGESDLAELFKLARRRAYIVLGDREIANDVARDTMIAYSQNRTPIKNSPKAWVAGVAKNIAIKVLRDNIKWRLKLRREPADALDAVAGGTLPEQFVLEEERRQLVQKILGELSESDQLVINLHYFESKTIEEIAKQLSKHPHAVHQQLYRARRHFKAKFHGVDGEV